MCLLCPRIVTIVMTTTRLRYNAAKESKVNQNSHNVRMRGRYPNTDIPSNDLSHHQPPKFAKDQRTEPLNKADRTASH